ncbi:hypothetical protein [Polaribacter sp.]|uniref:hypothetical protein n=1 Tax=Polaribacter sp. TaxID=1920175 RepID=UPI0040482BCA
MKLDKFISESLNSIITGIKNSKEFALQNGAIVNPRIGNWDNQKILTTYYKNEDGAIEISKVEFDIAVTTSEKEENGINAGISVYSFGLGAKSKETEENKSISRIKFHVRLAMPSTSK